MYTYLFFLLDLCYPQAETWCHLVSFQGGLAGDFSLLDQTTIKLGPGTVEEVNMQETERKGAEVQSLSTCRRQIQSMQHVQSGI